MPKKIYLIISFFYLNICSGQSFFTIDIDTNEFIENVNYSLFLKKKKVFNSITENKKITTINNEIEFDSISFSRIDYNTLGFPKKSIDSIISLKKKTIYLDEVVVGSKKDDYLLIGETNRFIKKQSRAFNEELIFGIVHKNDTKKEIELKKIAFFTEKIHYKTAYFSLGLLLIYMLLGDDDFYNDYLKHNNSEKIIESLNNHPVKNTRIYWLLSRCLVEEAKNRSIILL